MQRIATLALGLWIGAVACVSFVVAPRVFGFFEEPRRAGDLMLPIFRRVDAFGIVAALLFVVAARRSGLRALLAALMGGAAAVNLFALAPRIAARDEHLDLYHRVATGLWGFVLVGGILLLLAGPGRPRAA